VCLREEVKRHEVAAASLANLLCCSHKDWPLGLSLFVGGIRTYLRVEAFPLVLLDGNTPIPESYVANISAETIFSLGGW